MCLWLLSDQTPTILLVNILWCFFLLLLALFLGPKFLQFFEIYMLVATYFFVPHDSKRWYIINNSMASYMDLLAKSVEALFYLYEPWQRWHKNFEIEL